MINYQIKQNNVQIKIRNEKRERGKLRSIEKQMMFVAFTSPVPVHQCMVKWLFFYCMTKMIVFSASIRRIHYN